MVAHRVVPEPSLTHLDAKRTCVALAITGGLHYAKEADLICLLRRVGERPCRCGPPQGVAASPQAVIASGHPGKMEQVAALLVRQLGR